MALRNPSITVRELIAQLSDMNLDAQVVLVDPDTSWAMNPMFIENDAGTEVIIIADYGDVISREYRPFSKEEPSDD